MEAEVIRQRQIVDQLRNLFNELAKLNGAIEPEFKTDIVLLIGQHRHKFDEQKVADHTDCVTLHGIAGQYQGIVGLLGIMVDREPVMRQAIDVVHNYIHKND